MYQFTTTNVINSNEDSSGKVKFSSGSLAATVKRVGKFLEENIVSMHKRAYSAAVLEVGTVTVPALTAGEVIALEIDIKLEGNAYSEYAVSNSQDFKKPVTVEVIATGVAATDAAALSAEVNKLKDRFDAYEILTTVAGAVITVSAKNEYQRFDSIKVLEQEESTNTIYDVEYVTKAIGAVTVNGKEGHGDDAMMMRKIKLPTLDNYRPIGAIDADGRPIMGGNYSQYTLRYSLEKDGTDGIAYAGGKSITTHVFYIHNSIVTPWESTWNDDVDSPNLDGNGKWFEITA